MRATVGSAGYDFYSIVEKILIPFKTELAKTDVEFVIPTGFYSKVVGRSGLALSSISTHVGTLHSDFCGNVCVFFV